MSHKIVIVGGGAGGLELATVLGKKLRGDAVEVVLVDRSLTHIWKPLLHEVAAGVMDASQEELSYAAQAKWNHFRFVFGRMEGLDRQRKVIKLAGWSGTASNVVTPPTEQAYDTLIIAIGSVGNDFGCPGIEEHCIFLDSTAQAQALHDNLLERHFSNVSIGLSKPLRVAIVGGGATGVELSAELFEANRRLAFYHQTKTEGLVDLDITLVEGGPKLLPALPDRIGMAAKRDLEDMGIKVLTNTAVKRAVAAGLIDQDGNTVDADVMVWAAGVRAPAFLHEIDGLESNRGHQLVVQSTLQTTRDPAVFAFGDCAACPVAPGAPLNTGASAQAAHQQATLLVKNVQRRLAGQPLLQFTFQDKGTLVSLASRNAFGKVFGNRIIEGWLARFFYISLYRMHQSALYGPWRTGWRIVGSLISRGSRPIRKLH